MSLLKRIESARPAGEGAPAGAPLPVPPPGAAPPPGAPPGAPMPPPPPMPQRSISQVPVRESFRDTKYRIQVQSKSEGYLLDSKLTVTDSKSGDLLATNDDASRNDYDAAVEFVAKQDARVDVTLADMIDGFGPRHFYRLSIQESQPKCYLSITEDHFVVAADQSLEIPISVTRVAGFDGQVEISAVGLPDSISVQNVISEPKGDTSKSVKLKLTAAKVPSGQALGHGTFQIIGTFLDNNNQPTGVTTTATYALRPSIALENFWWTTPPAPTENTKP